MTALGLTQAGRPGVTTPSDVTFTPSANMRCEPPKSAAAFTSRAVLARGHELSYRRPVLEEAT